MHELIKTHLKRYVSHVCGNREHRLILEKREKCLKLAGDYLGEGKSVAIGMYPSTIPTSPIELLTLSNIQIIQIQIVKFELNG